MRLRAFAKINPYLNITGRRKDGYHELEIVFRPVSLCDELELELAEGAKEVALSCSRSDLTGDNIIYRAYDALRAVRPDVPGFRAQLVKNIPSGAGLGGGSSDAAAFLRGANELAGLGLSDGELLLIGAKVGADVPACLLGTDCIGGGTGDVLRPFSVPAEAFYIIVKPPVSFSTPEMYRAYDEALSAGRVRQAPPLKALTDALVAGDIRLAFSLCFNVFEDVVPCGGLIRRIGDVLTCLGADGAVMTGSGSCVVGYFADRSARDLAMEAMKKEKGAAAGVPHTSLPSDIAGALAGCELYSCGDALPR